MQNFLLTINSTLNILNINFNSSDGIKIIVHKKKCNLQQKCTIKKISSALENEIQIAILKKAVIIENMVLAYFLGLCSFLAIS